MLNHQTIAKGVQMRALSDQEIDSVNGGVAPLIPMLVAVAFLIGRCSALK